MTAAHRDANVLRWLGAYTASVTGDVTYFLALTWAATRTAGPAQAGAVLAAGSVPRALLMLGGGVVADRFGARRVVIGSDLVRCAVLLSAAAFTWLAGSPLWLLYVLAVVFGTVDALFMPAVGALPPQLTAPDQLARVQGMRTLSVRFANAVGPMAGALVLAAGGAAGAFGTAGLLFSGSLVLLLGVRVRPVAGDAPAGAGRTTPAQDFRAGLRHLRQNPHLSRLVLVIGLGEMCFSGPVSTGLLLLTDERGWGAGPLGWILAAFSLGGAASGLLLTAVRRVPYARAVMSCALLVTAVLVAAVGRAPGPGTAVTEGALLGVASGAATVLSNALLQERTEARYLGRVSSLTSLCTVGLSPLLYPLAGLVAAAWGTGVFFAGCGAVCLLAAGVSFSVRPHRPPATDGTERAAASGTDRTERAAAAGPAAFPGLPHAARSGPRPPSAVELPVGRADSEPGETDL
ncbi:MFS transporter [Streptomyces sp. NBC_00859]|uniref:MFS transporter n=1 Tax=Streptomyces sp. NBC_00859 TaxID=2903682 RepID=UPI00386D6C63|nr:MFS transporter [Streptomyces sp. NBC_00859]